MSHSPFARRLVAVAGTVALLATAHIAEAQNAALQARAKMQQRHQQTGSVGGGYRPYSAWTYLKSAQTHAQALNAYGQNVPQLPVATAREHLTEIQRNLTATREEIAKIGPQAAQEADITADVLALEKQLSECEKLCGMMEKTIIGDEVKTAQMCTHCSGLEANLKSAEAEHKALLKKLGIKIPGDHHDADAEHHHEPDAATGAKKN